MNYIVISPYYPYNFQKFSIELKNKGINVLGIGQEPYDQLGSELQGALTEYFRVNNLEDIDEVKRAVAFLFYKHGPIERIESQNEYWLNMDAELREQFNVPGVKPSELNFTKRKSEMKKKFIAAGAPVVSGEVVSNSEDVERVVKQLGLPLIAKPDIGVGAAATYALKTAEDVEIFKQNWDGHTDYFFEEFVDDAPIVTYDGLLDKEGNIVFETGFEYTYTPIELLSQTVDISYYVTKEIDPVLRKISQKIIKEIGMKERFFHIEFFCTGEQEYITIEYNNRPPGSFSMDLYSLAYDTNLYADYAGLVAGETVTQKEDKVATAAITRRAGVHYRYDEATLYERFGQYIVARYDNPEAFSSLQGHWTFMVKGCTDDELTSIIHDFTERVN
ncbi:MULTISPECIES: carbamoyl phosphate synthase large subunit [unclassified Facklamia]|uniref:ATP-grasp domain-containing protein n=1 Tax=Aerococcaceae TaxID=186827 RepID=UPI0013BBB5D3|nr:MULTISPECIES: carbamoyl phosphate synthase large subunit [unclassified Facklamia]MBS4461115.1 carbamoyl phosphate synthase large subunit [Aerococcaceae bacterium zg-B36]NEW64396.1 carbamoyl phosphate synthase large subunit [Facklamia sp. 252]NEW68477.1 carbamoyl phosphate synthase large subunit [Facklamia sp. 253]QQD64857.1 carbamoyl phosphate synthase large subunit [Aerococcaceae bacterium zg-252]